ncbi:MAG: DUF4363 family protein [Clostridiales bacterium]|uniref:DUF4363 family protein n=1 Tax=Clostridium sp. N3C TaxID=1776758 RepID=UPI00092DF35A|nr:DUF4363 family protein [Clostridium sp. N3C]NLZ47871.1 DUF4363 family protein [Clostridiales bacterium]SCN26257.1 hypothetical protein N3C_2749 [Clostridium sp. N3C]
MKNLWISISFFILMIIGMLYALNYLNTVCKEVEEKSVKLEELINAENWEEADKLSNDLYYSWIKKAKVMTVFVNHVEIDSLNNEILNLTQYVKCKSKDDALTCSHTIKFYSQNIADLQKLNISNIF